MEELLVHGPEDQVRQLLLNHDLLSSLTIKTDNGPSNLLLQGPSPTIQRAAGLFLEHNLPTFPVSSSSPPPSRLGFVFLLFSLLLGLLLFSGGLERMVEWDQVERVAGEGLLYLLLGWILLVIFAFLKLFSYSLPFFKRKADQPGDGEDQGAEELIKED